MQTPPKPEENPSGEEGCWQGCCVTALQPPDTQATSCHGHKAE